MTSGEGLTEEATATVGRNAATVTTIVVIAMVHLVMATTPVWNPAMLASPMIMLGAGAAATVVATTAATASEGGHTVVIACQVLMTVTAEVRRRMTGSTIAIRVHEEVATTGTHRSTTPTWEAVAAMGTGVDGETVAIGAGGGETVAMGATEAETVAMGAKGGDGETVAMGATGAIRAGTVVAATATIVAITGGGVVIMRTIVAAMGGTPVAMEGIAAATAAARGGQRDQTGEIMTGATVGARLTSRSTAAPGWNLRPATYGPGPLSNYTYSNIDTSPVGCSYAPHG